MLPDSGNHMQPAALAEPTRFCLKRYCAKYDTSPHLPLMTPPSATPSGHSHPPIGGSYAQGVLSERRPSSLSPGGNVRIHGEAKDDYGGESTPSVR